MLERAAASRCRAAEADKAGEVIKTLIETFRYPRKGPGMMWEAAARQDHGSAAASIHMGREVVRLRLRRRRKLWTHRRVTTPTARPRRSRRGTSSRRRRCASWSTASRRAPICAAARAASSRYRDFLTVALILKDRDLFPDNWIYIHDPA